MQELKDTNERDERDDASDAYELEDDAAEAARATSHATSPMAARSRRVRIDKLLDRLAGVLSREKCPPRFGRN